jgi:hypothetical protein
MPLVSKLVSFEIIYDAQFVGGGMEYWSGLNESWNSLPYESMQANT